MYQSKNNFYNDIRKDFIMYQSKKIFNVSEKISYCIRANVRENFTLYQSKCYNILEKPSHCIGSNVIMYQIKLKEIVGCIRVKQISY